MTSHNTLTTVPSVSILAKYSHDKNPSRKLIVSSVGFLYVHARPWQEYLNENYEFVDLNPSVTEINHLPQIYNLGYIGI